LIKKKEILFVLFFKYPFLFFYRLAFAKIWYDIYNNKHEHVVSLMLRKNYLRSKIQYRVPEFKILDSDQKTNIGGLYPFSTDLQKSEYGHAVAIKSRLLFINLIYLFKFMF
jgi:hypothetical protein